MEEKGNKRREWVKNVAIIFLTVLLILTFFSQTILNYSLPEVAAQYAQSGSITAKIRGNGTVESGDPYNVTATQTRTVASVAVRVGDEVQAGDVLLYLEDVESEELKNAKKALEEAQTAYNKALLQADVQNSMIQESGHVSIDKYRSQIAAAQAAVNAAQAEYDKWLAQSNDLTDQTDATADLVRRYQESVTFRDNAQNDYTWKSNQYNAADAEYEYYTTSVSVSGNDLQKLEMTVDEYQKKVEDLRQLCLVAEREKNEAKSTLDTAEFNLAAVKAELEATQASTGGSLAIAKALLDEKQADLNELVSRIGIVLDLESLYNALAEAQEAYNKEQEKATDAVIVSKIAGTVTTVNAVAGKEIANGDTVVVLQPEGQGYTLSFSVTNEQAKRLSVGDHAELVNSWRYDDVEVVLASIRPDPQNPGANKILNFNISGGVTAGQSLSVSVGERSSSYDAIVPNSAIREDNNGKFVLVVESKSSPLGNRYIATRMNVEVLASDDTQSAVSGLNGYEFVITTSTQPVEAGQQVRLANE
ncbi:MAG: HlyD family efflux transporter periplasmic adaptor subunit [Candidatus Gastranaerophilales bacterium]|nr:HlyD family efflux transporter periplasmic adaptor subunit [Candidatus Gastranaerophilales bacterium]